jgi:transposase
VEANELASHPSKRGELKAELLFWDEVGFSLQPSVRRTWAPVGQTPVLRCKGSWKKLSAIGVVAIKPDQEATSPDGKPASPDGKPASPRGVARELYFQLYEGAVNQEIVIAYLEEMKEQLKQEGVLPGRVILLWDNLGSHKSKKVLEYLEGQKDWLIVERLPAYAPELNPIEYVWSPLKGKDLANDCPENLEQLEERVMEGVDRIGDDKALLQGCVNRSPLFNL